MSEPSAHTAGIDPQVYANRWRILVVLCLSLMVIMIAIGMVADRWVFAQLERRVRTRFGLIAAT